MTKYVHSVILIVRSNCCLQRLFYSILVSGGLFGSTSTPTTGAVGGLFNTAATTGGGLFGSKRSHIMLTIFSILAATTGFGSTTSSGGLFGAKPTGGLFGSTTTPAQQPQTRQRETLNTILLVLLLLC